MKYGAPHFQTFAALKTKGLGATICRYLPVPEETFSESDWAQSSQWFELDCADVFALKCTCFKHWGCWIYHPYMDTTIKEKFMVVGPNL